MPYSWQTLSTLINRAITGYGFKIKPEANMAILSLNGQNCECAPGLKLVDKLGIKVSRSAGWIIGYAKFKTLDNDNYFMDWKPKEAMDKSFGHFCNSLIHLYADRKGMHVNIGAEERTLMGQEIFRELLGCLGDKGRHLCDEGYFVMRYKLEQAATPKPEVDRKLKYFATSGCMPPIIVTNQVMELLKRENDLLGLEKTTTR